MTKIRKQYLSLIGVGLIVGSLLSASTVLAQGIKDKTMLNSIAGKAGVSSVGSAETVAGTVIKAVLSVTGLIFLILMVYAGILWMTARGDESIVEKSKDTIQAALIGLALTVSAYAITVFINSVFNK